MDDTLTPEAGRRLRASEREVRMQLGDSPLTREMRKLADDHDAPPICEGCDSAATCSDEDGLDLCDQHAR